MSTRTCRVGIHGRNDKDWHDPDFQVMRDAGVEVVKAMSHTKPHHFERLKREIPDVEIITRLYTDGFGKNHERLSPSQFASRMIPVMADLRSFCTKFHIHNEPNHMHGVEGWGPTDGDAASFNAWFLDVYNQLKQAHPWASLGFPGMALPHFGHRDWQWLDICRPAIERADWLGVHCYWQTRPGEPQWKHEALGMNFRHYHNKYPNKTLEILECGNSSSQDNIAVSDETIASEYVEWLQEVFKHPSVNSASFYILSSPDPSWASFAWRTEENAVKPVVQRIRHMSRPQRIAVNTKPPAPKPVEPVTTPPDLTNQLVINAFNRASLALGLGDWDLLNRAKLDLKELARDQATRRAPYRGPKLADLPGLTDEQRQLVRAQLPSGVKFMAAAPASWLKDDAELLLISLTPPPQTRLRNPTGALETRVARAWNRYGNLLALLADRLDIDLDLAVAVMAAEGDPRGLAADNRLVLRFEPHLFYERWGRQHPDAFAMHFEFDQSRTWQGHRWRAAVGDWQEVHQSLASEWAAFELARSLDKMAACASASLGFAGLLGACHAAVGYESPAQMFDAFASSERCQALARFDLLAGKDRESPQVVALRRRDTETYATLAAGPAAAAQLAGALRAADDAFQRLSAG